MNKRTAAIVALALVASTSAWAESNPADPYDGYNRFMFKVNDTADRYVLTPVVRGYRAVTPSPVRTGVSNFYNNLRDVVSFGSNLLRLDIKRASEDLVRVGINTTFGIGGLIDIAGAGEMPNNKNTLGDTFASWGWKNSNYFVYPLKGPSTVRDSVGTTIVAAYPLDNTIFHSTAVRISSKAINAVNTRESLLDLTDSLDSAAIDKYAYMRDVYMRLRTRQVGGTLPHGEDDNIDIDDLVGSGDGNEAALPQLDAANAPAAPSIAPAAADYEPIEMQPAEKPQAGSQPISLETALPNDEGIMLGLWQPDSRLQY